MYLTIITLPLFAFLTVGVIGRKLGVRGSQIITSLSIIISAILSLYGFYEIVLLNNLGPITIYLSPWMNVIGAHADWAFYFDSISITMCVVVSSISSLVHLYSIGYMQGDPHIQRFFSYLSLFTFFMLLLVTGNNYLLMFVGWEGIGVSSYLLINFWFTRIQANKASMQAMLVNRVGDLGFVLGLFGIFWLFGSSDYDTVGIIAYKLDEQYITIVTLFLLIAAIGKSAQLGLHTWLPSAMEGPTPVSALIHAATLVTAGVYLILRSSPLFELAPTSLICVCVIGSLTAIFAATTGLFQNDLKRVIAYSTCSQLGYMVFALGLSQYEVAFFHLFNHAYFKALLFLSAGSIIHALHDEQDMRKMGGLVNILPFTYTMILIGSLSLMALPFLTGYYSKDAILEVAYGQFLVTGTFTYWLGTITATITAFYSSKALILGFFGTPNGSKKIYNTIHEAPLIMSIPLFLLSICSIFIGYITNKHLSVIGIGSSGIISGGVGTLRDHYLGFDIEFISTSFGVQFYPLFASLLGISLALIVLKDPKKMHSIEKPEGLLNTVNITRWLSSKSYWFDNVYNTVLISGSLHFGGIFARDIDKGFLSLLGPQGLQQLLITISRFFAIKIDTGFIPHYASIIIIIPIFIILSIFI
uniref:NADH-ubiquinone oxidoreductase chain 5 n=2 Tax=Allomyces TaxID=28581 RepID=NU5M_ALLMA|nr:NADH dehydrogenase, subunit 5 [Allomyces macrogynus]P50365.1 RecName: Full=NADH-ubiquinone oxidoreductase chain 5; AltName: Full=NADH dehydrogenase subunit 5 [Allomyces macrogynus]AAB05846.1 NADH dehydrogenase subunit 5 [Allomyces macrogynus]AAC49228.1 NADH dehydrogenase, subunit 5 [Allomyces macrogynus]